MDIVKELLIGGIAILIVLYLFHRRYKKNLITMDLYIPKIPTLENCKKCTDETVNKILTECHRREVAFDFSPQIKQHDLPQFDIEFSSFESKFFRNQRYPKIKNQLWGNEYAISVNEGVIVILRGWLPPDKVPNPEVHTYGNVPIKVVREVVDTFYKKVMFLTGRGFTQIHLKI